MPNTNRISAPYIKGGNPDTVNDSELYAGGELGSYYDFNDRTYCIVKLDSGATAGPTVGVVLTGQLAFWKDKDTRLVTNDFRFAIGGQTSNAWRNQVAGIFRGSITAGYYCHILSRGDNISVKSDGNGGVGQTAIAEGTADTSRVGTVAVGTAPTYVPVGIIRGAAGGGVINVDVSIPEIG